MNETRATSDADARLIVDYIEGRLVGAAREAFEERLLDDAELARATEEFAEGAWHLQRVGRAGDSAQPAAQPARERSANRWLPLALAAAALFAAGTLWLTRDAPAEAGFEVAVMRTGVKLADYAGVLGLDPELVPLGNRATRSQGVVDQALAPRVFLERARPIEEARLTAALTGAAQPGVVAESFGTPEKPVTAGLFTVAVRSARPFAPLVVALYPNGELATLFPEPGRPSTLLPAGTHVLPQAPLALDPLLEPNLELGWKQGFTLSRMLPSGSGIARVFVALRGAPLTGEDLAELERSRAAQGGPELAPDEFARSAARVAEALEARGFAVQSIEVREPSDG